MVDVVLQTVLDNSLLVVADVVLQTVLDNSLQAAVDVILQAVILRVVELKICK